MRRTTRPTVARTPAAVTFEPMEPRQLMSAVTPAGLPDRTFGNDTGFVNTHQAGSVVRGLVQSDGKALVVTDVADANQSMTSRVARFSTSGQLDASYAPGGTDGNGVVTIAGHAIDASVTPDGKLVVVGFNAAYQLFVTRLTAAGQLDRTFNGTGTIATRLLGTAATDEEGATSVAVDPSGRVVITGVADSTVSKTWDEEDFAARFTAAGKLDTSFNKTGLVTLAGSLTAQTNAGYDGAVVLAQPDGSYVAAVGGQKLTVVKLSSAGAAAARSTVDAAAVFFPGDATRVVDVTSIARTADGKVLYGGVVQSQAGGQVGIVGRLTASLAADKTFNPGLGVEDTPLSTAWVDRVAATASGKVLLVGATPSDDGGYNGVGDVLVQRLNADGSLDTTFGDDGQAPVQMESDGIGSTDVAVMSDGRLLVTADVSEYTSIGLERLTADPQATK